MKHPDSTANIQVRLQLNFVFPGEEVTAENNWIPAAGKKPYLMFRFYGTEEAVTTRPLSWQT